MSESNYVLPCGYVIGTGLCFLVHGRRKLCADHPFPASVEVKILGVLLGRRSASL
jgi:hypothetical protein